MQSVVKWSSVCIRRNSVELQFLEMSIRTVMSTGYVYSIKSLKLRLTNFYNVWRLRVHGDS